MPATSYVVTAWEALAADLDKPMAEVPVEFRDVAIHQPVVAMADQEVTLAVQLGPGGKYYVRVQLVACDCAKVCVCNDPTKRSLLAAVSAWEGVPSVVGLDLRCGVTNLMGFPIDMRFACAGRCCTTTS